MKFTYARHLGQCAAVFGLLVPALTANTVVPIALPSSQWGTQYYQTSLRVWGAWADPCSNPSGNTGGPATCSQSAAYWVLAGSETVSAYNDANGIHLYAQSVATDTDSGASWAIYTNGWAEAKGSFVDTLTNNTGVTAGFQIAFHLDGALDAGAFVRVPTVVADDGVDLHIHFYGAASGSPLQDLQDWNYDPDAGWAAVSQTLHQDYITNIIMLAPGESYSYKLEADLLTQSESHGDHTSLTATGDMSNTLSLTALSVYDQSRNPLSNSLFTSSSGMNYSGVPEPSTIGLLAVPVVALFLRARRRK